ncbi:MAG: hypothetical protein LZF86_160057 [Nitrospira sp.]|nr:MAG: hypothetical protein LZF86_160057 [Nitrospira sp.]
MEQQQKESYTEPVLVAHDMLRDITGGTSGVKASDKSVGEKPGAIESY